jgi:glycosyltransferase involved in cell wall biosynthesis
MGKKPLCSLIIRCFNEELHIGKLLAGVMEQTVKDVEIVLVDSGSTDATLSIASRYPVKILNIAPKDFSFGRALNVGCNDATGEFLVMASAHVYPVYKDWLEKLLAPFKDKDVALVYGKQRGPEGARFSEQQIYKKWFPDGAFFAEDHPFCNNANSAVRAELWKEMPFDEELTGLEDLDWAKRAIEEGYGTAYSSEAEIVHVHDETLPKVLNRYRREAIAFKRIYPAENFSFKDFLKLFFANAFTDYFHALQDGAFFKNIFSIPAFRFMQFLGTYRGFNQRGAVTENLRDRFYYPDGLFRKKPENKEAGSKRRIKYEHH